MARYQTWFTGVALCGAMLLGLSGCGSSSAPATTAVSPEIHGTWQGTIVMNEQTAAKMEQPELEAVRSMKMEMSFQPDGVLMLTGEANGTPYTSENHWTKVAAEGNKVTIKAVNKEGKEKDIDMIFEGSDTFSMPLKTEVADLGVMKFQRVR